MAVIGPNGAGKTTLFNLITGLLKPEGGKVFFKGQDITGLPPHEICRKGMSRSFQVVNIFQRLSIFENIQVSVLSRERKTWNLFTPSSNWPWRRPIESLGVLALRRRKDRTTGACSPTETVRSWRSPWPSGGIPSSSSSMNRPPAWPRKKPPAASN